MQKNQIEQELNACYLELEKLNPWPSGQFFQNELEGIKRALYRHDEVIVTRSGMPVRVTWEDYFKHACSLMETHLSPCYIWSSNLRFRKIAEMMIQIRDEIC